MLDDSRTISNKLNVELIQFHVAENQNIARPPHKKALPGRVKDKVFSSKHRPSSLQGQGRFWNIIKYVILRFYSILSAGRLGLVAACLDSFALLSHGKHIKVSPRQDSFICRENCSHRVGGMRCLLCIALVISCNYHMTC